MLLKELHELFSENPAPLAINPDLEDSDTKGRPLNGNTTSDRLDLQDIQVHETPPTKREPSPVKDDNYYLEVISSSIDKLTELYKTCAERHVQLNHNFSKQLRDLQEHKR
jgi:hypothetical protein